MKININDFSDDKRIYLLKYTLQTYIITQAILRTLLILYSIHDISLNIFELAKTFLLGAIYDIVIGLQALIPFFLSLLLLPAKWLNNKFGKYFICFSLFFMYIIVVFIEISQYLFWDEFQTNFNFIAVDYLIYTTEVIGNINESYDLWLVIPLLCFVAIVITYIQVRNMKKSNFLPLSFFKKTIGICMSCILPILFFYTVESRWCNLVSNNMYNVEIAGNGTYAFFSAFRNNELDYPQFYLTNDNKFVMQKLRSLLATNNDDFLDTKSVNRRINSYQPHITPNIVIIVVESLSADFMGSFGNDKNITPNLDKLARESLLFTNVYATGTRTVRGLEALSLCIPPTPGQSIVRRPNNHNLSLIGTVLAEHGYSSSFVYGGYGYFDNMNEFFKNNNYEVIDRTNIEASEIDFETIWGVADEILFDKALKEIDEKTAKSQKVFQMIVTTSNHRPFTYPGNRIDIEPGTRDGAVKYTDWAIGDFIKKANNKDWFTNTVFVIVADHQASSAGRVDLPINKYHIPCLIYAPQIIMPGRNERLMSQIDISPTLLGLLGHTYKSNFLGYDINNLEYGQERVFISTYQNLGYIKNDKLVILKPKSKAEMYKIKSYKNNCYEKIENEEEMINEAIAWYQGASYLYKNNMLTNQQ